MCQHKQQRLALQDRIFSRVGASDDLARGQSTFMVEMVETAAILNQSTERSIVILDEIDAARRHGTGWRSHGHVLNICITKLAVAPYLLLIIMN